jgi:hypothetical protein
LIQYRDCTTGKSTTHDKTTEGFDDLIIKFNIVFFSEFSYEYLKLSRIRKTKTFYLLKNEHFMYRFERRFFLSMHGQLEKSH